MEIPVVLEISARHIHLSQKDANILFGEKYNFKVYKHLSQKGQFAYEEVVGIESDGGVVMENVRVMGPMRESTYGEFSSTDLFQLKMKAPTMTESYDDKSIAAPILIKGPVGEIKRSAAIIKQRHVHCDVQSANKYGLKDGVEVSLKCGDERAVTFHKVVVRINEDFTFRVHLNVDEANAAGIEQGDEGWLYLEEKK